MVDRLSGSRSRSRPSSSSDSGPPPRVMCVCDPLVKQGHHYVQWVASGLYDCVYTPREEASVVIGLSSIGFWMMAQVPQLYKNWRNHTAASLSAVFLLLWLGGDATNLIGCLLTQQLPTQIYTAMYFVFMDMLLFYQFLYYTSKNNRHVGGLLGLLKQTLRRRKARSTHEQLGDEDSQVLESAPLGDTPPVTRYDSQPFDEDAPDRSPSHVVFAVLVFVVLWPVWSRSLSFGFLGEENEAGYTGRSLLEEDICGDSYKSIAPWQEVLGQVVGWISAVIYVSSRVPQIIKNKRRKSVEGLSGYMFMAAVMGNVAYSLSIFLRSTSSHFLAPKVPWIIGSVGTLQFDFTVLAQFLYYRTRAKRVVLKEDLDDAHSSGTLVQQHV